MGLEWLNDTERDALQLEAALQEFCRDLPPDDWQWEMHGDYRGYPGIVDAPDETNSGDVHYHGAIVGQWMAAKLLRQAIANTAEVHRLCRAVRELAEALERLDAYLDFGESLPPGEWGVKDPTGINAAFRTAREVLERWQRGVEG